MTPQDWINLVISMFLLFGIMAAVAGPTIAWIIWLDRREMRSVNRAIAASKKEFLK